MRYDPDLVINDRNVGTVQQALIAQGREPVEVFAMTRVQLINAYHGQGPSDVQRLIADAILQTMGALVTPDTLISMIRTELDKIAPRQIVVTTPRGSVTLDGPTHYKTGAVLRAVGRGDAVMMVGPAGCGKTTIGEHVAKALQLPFYVTSTINDTHELTGYMDGLGVYHGTPFRTAFEHGGVWIADEIDAWDAPALLAANAALANGFAAFPDISTPMRRHANFRMVATANTFGTGADRVYVGRNELDAASLDRFALIEVDYDLNLERMFANGRDDWLDHVWNVRKAVNAKKIRHVVSSRCIGRGSLALIDGEEWEDVEAMYLYKGISKSDRAKVEDSI